MKNSGSLDTYKTLLEAGKEVLYKEKNSKFFGYAIPLSSREEADYLLQDLRQRRKKATHLCYAWQWGLQEPYFRINDDGEPTHSAGMPIYGQIQAFGLTNILVAVARIYGGTKLGVGGLIHAYRTTAKMALQSGTVVSRTLTMRYKLLFDYPQLDLVLRLLKQKGVEIVQQDLLVRCSLLVEVRLKEAKAMEKLFGEMPGISVSML